MKTRHALFAVAAIALPLGMFAAYAGFVAANAMLIGCACFLIGGACVMAVAAEQAQ